MYVCDRFARAQNSEVVIGCLIRLNFHTAIVMMQVLVPRFSLIARRSHCVNPIATPILFAPWFYMCLVAIHLQSREAGGRENLVLYMLASYGATLMRNGVLDSDSQQQAEHR